MSFRENLKAELTFADMRVKELAKLSGIKKTTIDSYLRENNNIPSVEAAVRIAKALNVSVEYLVMGEDPEKQQSLKSLGPDLRQLLQSIEKLNPQSRKIVINNAQGLADAMLNRDKKFTS